jgi:NAD(P) transhydrogenase subunit alpha
VGVDATGADSGAMWANIFGFIALVLACVNIFGGFLVTERMLAMYKKKG